MRGSIGVAIKTDMSYMDRDVKILSSDIIPHASVLLSCHYFDPTGPLCHVPFHSQRFMQAHVHFLDDGTEANLIFTEHHLNPVFNPSGDLQHHLVELIVLGPHVEFV